MTPALLQAEALQAHFPGGPPVLAGASVSLHPGERVALLGANGSGKTTLLRCLSGAMAAQSGQVLVDGSPLRHDKAALRAHRARVQLVLQNPDDQLFSADVTQDVSFGPLNLGLDEATVRQRVADSLALLGIEHLAERPTHQLSYGERKRVVIAGAVAMRPQVLLLDEPTAGLDPAGVTELLDALARLRTAILLATHEVDLAFAWADRVAVVADHQVREGGIELLGEEDLLARARLRPPWQVQMMRCAGLTLEGTLPRTAAQVAARLGISAAGTTG
ncbi:ATP-binding cassette domain-containing protein [Aestuariimicrobium sp. p3-SID1156]|uniref:energy-coupling factor ABC transporter ATP-binding protein n=1 Tax=Aestuariimicrobium sp. p3-SID1156 TaxID=2916038 RepID=UPI00223C3F26|nr:ATP-binding cassette domain-containing protein [Aestuariimicrobium sp. p3-SID1156]MCT1458620.1 ATP-binding cassette domain-containing protein [Aestuariimicrobium sp. p3-SID1156]